MGKIYPCAANSHWKTSKANLDRLANFGRIAVEGTRLRYKRYANDFSVVPINSFWKSMQIGTGLLYVAQTSLSVIQRCLLMTSNPGDLALDITCGSGTTAYVAEPWRRCGPPATPHALP